MISNASWGALGARISGAESARCAADQSAGKRIHASGCDLAVTFARVLGAGTAARDEGGREATPSTIRAVARSTYRVPAPTVSSSPMTP
jgi:hypothetical protein